MTETFTAQLSQAATRLLAAFSLAYLLSGFMHALIMVVLVTVQSGDIAQTLSDAGLFLRYIVSETFEAPLSGGFIKDVVSRDTVSYINLYPFIAPIFIVFYFCFSRGWRWLKWTPQEA